MREQPKARLTLQQHQQAINEAIWIDASPHEWPTVDKMWLLCSALIDSVQMVDYLRIRLATVEAEQNAARAEVESTWRCFRCGFCTTDYKQAEAHFGDRDEEMALCQWWKDSTDTERVQALQDAIEEQNAAQAGEARAVEALKRCHEGAARQLAEPCDHDDDQYALAAIATDCEAVLAEQGPALDWLAQQRREAAVEALEKLEAECSIVFYGDLPHVTIEEIREHLAALRAGEVGDD